MNHQEFWSNTHQQDKIPNLQFRAWNCWAKTFEVLKLFNFRGPMDSLPPPMTCVSSPTKKTNPLLPDLQITAQPQLVSRVCLKCNFHIMPIIRWQLPAAFLLSPPHLLSPLFFKMPTSRCELSDSYTICKVELPRRYLQICNIQTLQQDPGQNLRKQNSKQAQNFEKRGGTLFSKMYNNWYRGSHNSVLAFVLSISRFPGGLGFVQGCKLFRHLGTSCPVIMTSFCTTFISRSWIDRAGAQQSWNCLRAWIRPWLFSGGPSPVRNSSNSVPPAFTCTSILDTW